MTWEQPDHKWIWKALPSTLLGTGALVLLIIFSTGGRASEKSYQSSCQEQGGEWLEHAATPTCVFKGGRLVTFEDARAAPRENPVPLVSAAMDEDVLQTPECSGTLGIVGSFDDYPATETFTGRTHALDFSTWPAAAKYRTAISKDVAHGVNFAGAYVISTWGEPSEGAPKRMGYAVIDARNGKILAYNPDNGYTTGIHFVKTSRYFTTDTLTGRFVYLLSGEAVLDCGR